MMVVRSFDELGRSPMIGDRVKIVDKKVGAKWNPQGIMDKYLGAVMTVDHVYDSFDPIDHPVKLKECSDNGENWVWFSHMIEGLVIERAEDIAEDPSTWTSDVIFEALLS